MTRTTTESHKEFLALIFRGVYRLQNTHRLKKGSIWQRQQGLNSRPQVKRVEYTVHIHNLSRFSDVGRIAVYIKVKIPTEFEIEDLDTHTPESLMWWNGIRKIADAIPTLHWRPDDRLTEGVIQFSVDVILRQFVYPSVGRVALFSVNLI